MAGHEEADAADVGHLAQRIDDRDLADAVPAQQIHGRHERRRGEDHEVAEAHADPPIDRAKAAQRPGRQYVKERQ